MRAQSRESIHYATRKTRGILLSRLAYLKEKKNKWQFKRSCKKKKNKEEKMKCLKEEPSILLINLHIFERQSLSY